jgi:NADP-dependent 3-hydroxy acid dehydrogenase YdfG
MKKLVVITGASSGIGKATAEIFSKNRYPVLLIARRISLMREMKLPRSICVKFDINDKVEYLKGEIIRAEKKFGPINCLINNAGVMYLDKFEKQAILEIEKMFETNVLGLLKCTKIVLKNMIKRGEGTIINVGSTAGKKIFDNHTGYCGTKFAVHALTEAIRGEVAKKNIRVTLIAPGVTETELLTHTNNKKIINSYIRWKTGIGGALMPKDIAEMIFFVYSQPQNICIREIVVAPTKQVG